VNNNIYLDYNSTTPVDAKVLEVMLPYFTENFGNAASKTHSYGWIAEEAVKKARQQVATLINCEEQEIIFTSGATESLNLAIKGVFENYSTKGNHIITVATEHNAVLDTCKKLEKRGATITYLPVDHEGMIDLDQLKNAITEKTILVCVMYANNETGTIQPIKQIADIVHDKGSIFLCDATQAIGKIPVDVNADGIDMMCISAHKIYGPKGVGALFIRRKNPRVIPASQIDGGGHERGFRSGTLNVPGIVGLGTACELAGKELWDYSATTSVLRTRIEQLIEQSGDVRINGSIKNRLPNTSNISIKGIKAERLIAKIPGIALSMGSACTSAIMEPSHVLKAMGISDELAYASVRISLGKSNTPEQIDEAAAKIKQAIAELRA
jgi:cysteine desulfurase